MEILRWLFPQDNWIFRGLFRFGVGYVALIGMVVVVLIALKKRQDIAKWLRSRQRRVRGVNETARAENNSRGRMLVISAVLFIIPALLMTLSFLHLYPFLIALLFCLISVLTSCSSTWLLTVRRVGDEKIDKGRDERIASLFKAAVFNIAGHLAFVVMMYGAEVRLAERTAAEQRQEAARVQERADKAKQTQLETDKVVETGKMNATEVKKAQALAEAERQRRMRIQAQSRKYLIAPGLIYDGPLPLIGVDLIEPTPAVTQKLKIAEAEMGPIDWYKSLTPGDIASFFQLLLAGLCIWEFWCGGYKVLTFVQMMNEDFNGNGKADYKERLEAKASRQGQYVDAEADLMLGPGEQNAGHNSLSGGNADAKAYLKVPKAVGKLVQASRGFFQQGENDTDSVQNSVLKTTQSVLNDTEATTQSVLNATEKVLKEGNGGTEKENPDSVVDFDAAPRQDGRDYFAFNLRLPLIDGIRYVPQKRDGAIHFYLVQVSGSRVRLGQFGKRQVLDLAEMNQSERDIAVNSYVAAKLFEKGFRAEDDVLELED